MYMYMYMYIYILLGGYTKQIMRILAPLPGDKNVVAS